MTVLASRRRTRTEAALDLLRREIATGRYSRAEMLPGERELAASLSVSRTTLRRLLADLVDEGMLRHRQGVGTFIAREAQPVAATTPAPPRAARLRGFAEDMAARGMAVLTQALAGAVGRPTPEEAMMLGCSPEEPILRLLRLRLTDGSVLALDQAAVPCRFLDRPQAVGASLYASLEARGFAPVRALARLQAVAIGEAEATLLGVAPGTAGVTVRRTAYLVTGACCDFTRSTYPASRYDAVTEIVAPAGGDGSPDGTP